MEENPFVKAINRVNEGLERFFFDAFTALTINDISGDYVEFGSWGCNTLRHAYFSSLGRGPKRHFWAFDSFSTLPEHPDPRDRHPALSGGGGANGVEEFHETCARFGVPRDAYTAIEGYFEETLPPLGADGAPNDIALVYVDCNLYSSTVTVLEFLATRLKPGMIIGFDDYFLYSAETGVSGEREALDEFLGAHPEWQFNRFKDIHWGAVSFVVERTRSGTPRLPY
jgi:hypothetical protein